MSSSIQTKSCNYDIIVYGSSPGSCGAAIQAARLGRKVALITPDKHIGGNPVNGLGATDIDGFPEFKNSTVVGGLPLELGLRISDHYGRRAEHERVLREKEKNFEVWRVEPHVTEKIIAELLKEHIIDIVYDSLAGTPDAVAKETSRESPQKCSKIISLKTEKGDIYTGKVFIDGTYEGDLLAAAGVPFSIGREGSAKYGEYINGKQANTTFCQINVPVDPYIEPGNPKSGLIYTVSDEPVGKAGEPDNHSMAYSYRQQLTQDPKNRKPFTKPEDYDVSKYEIYARFSEAGGQLHKPRARLPNGKTDLIGTECGVSTSLVGMHDTWPNGSGGERARILRETTSFIKGLFYFFSHDERLPADFRETWKTWGYPLDEYQDNDNFNRCPYIREGRRMVGDYVITLHAGTVEPDVADGCAVAFWPPDSHHARRIVVDGHAKNEGFILREKGLHWRPFPISYRALTPLKEHASNLITPTCPSSSHCGYSYVRIEHTFWQLGQAAADAAHIAIEAGGIPLRDVPYGKLKQLLDEQGVVYSTKDVGAPNFEEFDNKGGLPPFSLGL